MSCGGYAIDNGSGSGSIDVGASTFLDTSGSYQATVTAQSYHTSGRVNSTSGAQVRVDHPLVKATSTVLLQFTGETPGVNATRQDMVRVEDGYFEIYYQTLTAADFEWQWVILRF